jgi:nucleoside-diphosphate-sugar epimerase
VTGGAGFIGSHLVDRLILDGHQVLMIDDLSNGNLRNVAGHLKSQKVELVRADFADSRALAELLPGSDVVVHLAALVSVTKSVADPESSRRTNAEGTIKLLDQCVINGVKKFIFASSAAVYGESNPPLKEDMSCKPLSPYAASKVAGEAYCHAYANSYDLETVILRFMNVYGPRRSGGPYSGVMTKFAEALQQGKGLMIYGDGEQERDFVHVSDVVSSIAAAMTNPKAVGETFNIGSGVPTSINGLAELFISAGGKRVPIEHGPARKAEIKASYADISKARGVLEYSPTFELRKGVGEYLTWYQENCEIQTNAD